MNATSKPQHRSGGYNRVRVQFLRFCDKYITRINTPIAVSRAYNEANAIPTQNNQGISVIKPIIVIVVAKPLADTPTIICLVISCSVTSVVNSKSGKNRLVNLSVSFDEILVTLASSLEAKSPIISRLNSIPAKNDANRNPPISNPIARRCSNIIFTRDYYAIDIIHNRLLYSNCCLGKTSAKFHACFLCVNFKKQKRNDFSG